MHILIIGSGGREHALAWKIAQSPMVTALSHVPGNPGMATLGPCYAVSVDDVAGLVALAQDLGVDFVVIGPEISLALGLADALEAVGIPCFGASQKAAQLESSKAFTKAFCDRHSIPTAAYAGFDDLEAARDYLKTKSPPYILKADGLAAGKGVAICQSLNEALGELEDMLGGRFGAAGNRVIIEDFMTGEEASVFALCDGKTAMVFGWAQDHKRAFDGDLGPNTGGMGAYAPAPIVTSDVLKLTQATMFMPTLLGMSAESMPYKGVLYAGLMIEAGKPRLVEYNARFGDPECQVLMLRLKSDLLPYLLAARNGGLDEMPEPQWHEDVAICVVYAAKGYPQAPVVGTLITGADQDFGADVTVFHASTKRHADGSLAAAGGRVLNICARGKTLQEARTKAYAAIDKIVWDGGFYRSDIGWRAG
jgi:phosphoribosylamine---glycine ligase